MSIFLSNFIYTCRASNPNIQLSQAKKYLSVPFLTKPHLKKYLESSFGDPICLDTDDDWGMIIALCLDKNVYPDKKKEIVHRAFDKYDTQCTLHLPVSWIRNNRYGVDISEKNTIFINKLLEKQFKRELFQYTSMLTLVGVERKTAMQEFCMVRGIEVGSDTSDHITIDNLLKLERRIRNQKENPQKYQRQLSVLKPKIRQGSFFDNYNNERLSAIRAIA